MEVTATDLMRLTGNKDIHDFYPTKDIIKSIRELSSLSNNYSEEYKAGLTNLETLKKNAKDFLSSIYNLHNIGYLPDNSKRLFFYKIYYSLQNDYEKILEKYNKCATIIDPFDLPIYPVDNVLESKIGYQSFPLVNYQFSMDVNLYFKGIALYKVFNKRSTAFYIHEITHSQVDSNKNSYDYYDNGEVLSIFNELLYGYSTDNELLLSLITFRINRMVNDLTCILYKIKGKLPEEFTSTNYVDCVKYLVSTLEAFKLLHNYIYSPNQEKFLKSINDVFDGNIKIEELLDNNGITLDNLSNQEGIQRILK